MYWLKSSTIKITHGFSTRNGGVSVKPYDSLNLGDVEDLPENITENRQLALNDLGLDMNQVSYLNQIHSNMVCEAKVGKQTGDAIVTNKKNIAIAIAAADCYPILLSDEKNNVIGAAHCGWKGTLSHIVKNTIEAMCNLGSEPQHIKMAIGQGISMVNYKVSDELILQFKEAKFPNSCWNGRHLNLLEANKFVALQAGILETNIWSMNRCTTESDFFSYRRDNGKTGRMWAIIVLK